MEFVLEVHAKVHRAIIDFSKIYTFIVNFFRCAYFMITHLKVIYDCMQYGNCSEWVRVALSRWICFCIV
jgi:hypothetical protein